MTQNPQQALAIKPKRQRYISDYPYALRRLADEAAQNAAEHPAPGARKTWAAVAEAINKAANDVQALVDNRG